MQLIFESVTSASYTEKTQFWGLLGYMAKRKPQIKTKNTTKINKQTKNPAGDWFAILH